MTIAHYLPIWFQAIKGASAVKSGVMNIPLLLSLMIGTLLAGMLISKIHLRYEHGPAKWVGYQVLYRFGLVLGMQQGAAAIQAVIPKYDTPQAISFLLFGQQLGGTVVLRIGGDIPTAYLAGDIRTSLPEVNLDRISNSGASDLRGVASGLDMVKLLQAYNGALRYVFYLAVAVSELSLAGASLVEWKNLIKVEKKQKAGKVRLSGIAKDQLPKG
ncbi:hypothetical protein MferCBS49748_005711 [Microsporum ferrugineum]